MSKNEARKPARPADQLVEPVSRKLKQSELEQATGGSVTLSDFHFIKRVDKASPL